MARYLLNPSQLLLDAALLLAAWWAAFWLRFNLDVPEEFSEMALTSAPWVVMACLAGLVVANVYRQVWRYAGLPELRHGTWFFGRFRRCARSRCLRPRILHRPLQKFRQSGWSSWKS